MQVQVTVTYKYFAVDKALISGPESDIFTVVLPKHYSPPPGFCFDVNCNDVPIIDDPSIPDYNVIQRVCDKTTFQAKYSSHIFS